MTAATSRTLLALRFGDFRLMCVGQLLSNLGGWLVIVAAPFSVFDLTGSALATGVAFVAATVPAPLLGTDRRRRRRPLNAAR